MRVKKLTVLFLALLLVVSTLLAVPYLQPPALVDAATSSGTHYFYDQLPDKAKVFYEAMVRMYDGGIFKTGTESYELTKEDGRTALLSQDDVNAYMRGQSDIMADYGAARDAFYADYPDVFYVDFSNLSVRMTTSEDGTYHVYLGAGRTVNYYTQGFTDQSQVDAAIAEYEAVVTKIVAEAEKVTVQGRKSVNAKKVEFVHNYLTHNISYRLENQCKPENIGFVRTSYGALVKHEGVCEAYTRAMKSILDRLGIPCVMVQGIFVHTDGTEKIPEYHIWDYVQIDDVWYAVDATMDDPYTSNTTTGNGVDGYESTEYLLVGELKMNEQHVPNGIMSTANYEFTYPELSQENYGVVVTNYDNGLTVRYKEDGRNIESDSNDEIPAGEYWVSFQGKGYAAAAADGYYMLNRFFELDSETNELTPTDWFYIEPQVYGSGIEDTEDCLHLPLPQVEYVEFAVTDIVPDIYSSEIPDFTYYGDSFSLIAQTGMLYNPNGTYIAPPYVKTASPSVQSKLMINGKTYHITITYTEALVQSDENVEPGISVKYKSNNFYTADQYSTVSNLTYNGATVEFDFKPSDMFADDNMFYIFTFTGLEGVKSHKAPNSVPYLLIHASSYCSLGVYGYNWNIFGQPALLENSDLSMTDWETSDGTSIADLEQLKSRMVLVASSTTSAEADSMNEMIEDQLNDKILKSETYNINLTICQCMIIKTGEGVRVSVGFPEGYGPDDEGVTFKAYHFIKDENGNTVGVEEIPCIVTRYGLIITCSSFSPFAIAAVEDDGTNTNTDKAVILSNTIGGTVTASGENSIFTLSEGESKEITIQADKGYVIDYVLVDGELLQDVSGKSERTITLEYDKLKDSSAIVDVAFIPATSLKPGETSVVPVAAEATFDTQEDATIEKTIGEELTLAPEITSEGEYTYQWFKTETAALSREAIQTEGTALTGETDCILTIKNLKEEDAGTYYLQVTSFAGASTSISRSGNYIVTVNGSNGNGNDASGGNSGQQGGSGDNGGGNGGSGDNGGSNGGSGDNGGGNGGSGDNSGSGNSANTNIILEEDPAVVGETPITGDNNHIFLWFTLMFAGVMIIIAPMRYLRKKD